MKNERRGTKIQHLAALLLFSVLTACLLFVLLGGARIYRSVAEQGQESFDRRTASQYLATRVRQADAVGALRTERFGGGTALVISEQIDGERYETRIYCHDGWLRELFSEAGYDAAPEDGEMLLPLAGLELTLENGLLRAKIRESGGREEELWLACRSGKETGS